MVLRIESRVLEAITAAAYAAHPQEACGILLGETGRITAIIEAANVHPDPQTHFEIDPQTIIDAHRAARSDGPDVLGYYHSHPAGNPHPSITDQQMAAGDGKVWAIAAGEGVLFWFDNRDGFKPASYEVI